MSRIKISVLTLFALFAIGAVASAASSAAVWRINGTEITTAKKAKSKGTLKLADTGAGTEIECEGKDEGTVGAGSKDEVTKIEATNCKFIKAGSCEASKPVTAKAVNLPWKTELYEPKSGEIRDHIKATTGEVGWAVECTVFGVFKIQDECKAAESNTAMTNVTGGVDATFDATTPKANCSVGGTGTGSVLGTDLNENPSAKEVLTVK